MIYLDSAAFAKQLDLKHVSHEFGNYSSRSHRLGIKTKAAVEMVREELAEFLGVPQVCVVFTAGATDSLEILGRRRPFTEVSRSAHSAMRDALVQEQAEHSSVDGAAQLTSHFGYDHVNNESGVVFNQFGVPASAEFVTADLTQAIFKVAIDKMRWNFGVASAHKFHGPLGVGLLVCHALDDLEVLIDQRTRHRQEFGIRPGTLNAPAIIQTGQVVSWMLKNGDEYRAKLKHLQSTFENKITSLTDCWIIGAEQERAPHITSLNLPGVDNEALIASVNDRLAIASGSACTSEKVEPSHVLMAMFNDREIADTTVRISYGWFNTETEVLEAAEIIAKAAETIRSFSL